MTKDPQNNEWFVAICFETEEGNEFWWEYCAKDDCRNFVYRVEESKFCYPHSRWYRPIICVLRRLLNK